MTKKTKLEIIDNDRYINFYYYTGEFDNYGFPIFYGKTYFFKEYAWKNRKNLIKFFKNLFLIEVNNKREQDQQDQETQGE